MKLKPFKAWLLYDFEDTYAPTIHTTRQRAIEERDYVPLRDAKWRIVRVNVSGMNLRHSSKE